MAQNCGVYIWCLKSRFVALLLMHLTAMSAVAN